MTPMSTLSLFFLSSLSFLSSALAQGRSPHGLVYENPIALSPAAFDFFHPNTPRTSAYAPCAASDCAPLPLSVFPTAADVAQATEGHENNLSNPQRSGSKVGAVGIAGIVFGFVFAVLLAMGVYHVVVTRRANVKRANSVKPDA